MLGEIGKHDDKGGGGILVPDRRPRARVGGSAFGTKTGGKFLMTWAREGAEKGTFFIQGRGEERAEVGLILCKRCYAALLSGGTWKHAADKKTET